jgi:hypothetical protein
VSGEQRSVDDGKMFDVSSEKVAQSDKGTDGFHIGGQFGIFNHFELVLPWLDAFWHQCES